jgi:outer membrane protein assembly factor BamB
MSLRTKKYIYSAIIVFAVSAAYTFLLSMGCSGGKGDPIGAMRGLLEGQSDSTLTGDIRRDSATQNRVIWGGYALEISPLMGEATVRELDRSLDAHFNVTGFVKKPACMDCIKLENFTFDKSAGIIDLDAKLTNPTDVGGYDVRAVLLLDEWNTGRKLETAHGFTDFWSKDPYHPDPFINFAREKADRLFGAHESYSTHVTLFLPLPSDLVVPFIIDASYPDHPLEPVEMMNIQTSGTVHPTGYDLHISLDLLDWQNDPKGVYVDCSALNPLVGMFAFSAPEGGSSSTWTIDLTYSPGTPFDWLPTVEGVVDLPVFALDYQSEYILSQAIPIEVTQDTDPPQWTGEVGIDEIWWGGSKAIVSYFPATDPSGPVKYNIYSTTDITFIPPAKNVITGWSHYSVETVDGATYTFIVKAEDSAGNETDNGNELTGSTKAVTELWEKVFIADLESSPTVADTNSDGIQDVIFGCDDGNVYSLAGDSGTTQWFYETGAMIKSTPALRDVNDDDVMDVVVGSNDTNVYAIDLIMGMPFPIKTFETTGVVESSPVCADQTGDSIPEVVVGSFDGNLYAFKGGSGDLLVSYNTGASVKATPSLEDFDGDGHYDVVVASGGVVRAINGITGASLWSYDFETGFSLGSPAIGDVTGDGTGDVILGSGNSIFALDVKNHEIVWSNNSLAGNFDTSPALGDFTGDGIPDVAISSRYLYVYLLDGKDGSVIWRSDDSIYMPTSPAIADVNDDGILDVIVGAADFHLRALNGADGYTLFSYLTDPCSAITTVPLVADIDGDDELDIVFGTESNEMVAITVNRAMPTNPSLIPWPKFMRNRSNTGNLGHPLY